MGGFKRFCMFVFGLAGLLGVIALSLTWVGPWTSQASALMSLEYYFYAVEVCVAAITPKKGTNTAPWRPKSMSGR